MSRFLIPLRLLAAFLCGWLFAYLHVVDYIINGFRTSGIYPGTVIPLLVLLLPLGLGGVAALTAGRRNIIPLAMGTSLLALTGWYVYWLPGAIRDDAAEASLCHSSDAPYSCHHGLFSPDSNFRTSLLVYSWLIGVVLVLVSSLVTSLIIYFIMKHDRQYLRQ